MYAKFYRRTLHSLITQVGWKQPTTNKTNYEDIRKNQGL